MIRKRLAVIFITLLSSVVFVGASSIQSKDGYVRATEDALSSVLPRLRNRLVERLNFYVKNVRQKNFSEIYDLMPEDCRYHLTKDDWLSQAHYEGPGQLQEFLIEEAFVGDSKPPDVHYGERWVINGCATYKKGKEVISYKAGYAALLLGDEWYICWGGIAVEGPDNQYIKCSD